jgi:RNA polymerase sigma-70 factor (ECF subfamily)
MNVKIVSLLQNEKSLIRKACEGHRESQKGIYERYAPGMLALCQRYVKDPHFAEDVMIEGFVKVFRALPGFRFEGSFEGWIRRIMVREAIDFLRKRPFVVYDESQMEAPASEAPGSDPYHLEALEQLIEDLPEGYRLVFTLYAVEGYKHSEISTLLDISESTSKSQLYKARKELQKKINESSIPRYGTR